MIKTGNFSAYARGGYARDGGGIIALAFLAGAIYIGYLCADYLIWFIFGKDIPWYGDVLVAIITADLVVPITLVSLILNSFGVVEPPLAN